MIKRTALLALASLLTLAACGEKAPPAPKKFKADPAKPLAIAVAGVSVEAPANLEILAASAAEVKLGAKGLPGDITITVKETSEASGTGTGKECTNDVCTFKVFAPCRKLTCAGSEAFSEVAPAVCGSLTSTFVPASVAGVRLYGTMGGAVNCSDADKAAADTLKAPIEALEPAIKDCFTKLGARPAAAGGKIKVRVETGVDAKAKPTLVVLAKVEGLEGDLAPLQACLDGLVKPLNEKLPAIAKKECGVGQDYIFEVKAEATCAAK